MQFKKILTTFALTLAFFGPSVSSAMSDEQIENSIKSATVLLDIAQSAVGNLTRVSQESLTGSQTGSYDVKDANRDGKVTNADIVHVHGIYTNTIAEIDPMNGDVNSDGRVGPDDIFFLRDYFKSMGDYVNAYDLPTIGAGWKLVPPDGKLDQRDIDALKFSIAVYKQNSSTLVYEAASLGDFDYNLEIEATDLEILTNHVKYGSPVIHDVSPGSSTRGIETTIDFTGTNLSRIDTIVFEDNNVKGGRDYKFGGGTFKTHDSRISLTLPSNLPAGKYRIRFYLNDGSHFYFTNTKSYEIVESTPTDPPAIIQSYPAGDLPVETESTYLIVVTDMPSVCRYGIDPNAFHEKMTEMTFTAAGENKNGHAQPLYNLPKNETLTYYVSCKSFDGKTTANSHKITFSIGSPKTLELKLKSSNINVVTKTYSNDYRDNRDIATFKFVFEATAVGGDIFIDQNNNVINHKLIVNNAVALASASTKSLKITGAEKAVNADLKISKGKTALFTFTLMTDKSVTGDAKVILDGVSFSAEDDKTEELKVPATPSKDWTLSGVRIN